MKKYPAKKEIKIMGIVMIAVGILVVLTGTLPRYVILALGAFLMAYGLMHVIKTDRFK